jgi:uncharacterized BrkB/YihY/UPF0761 family membrane protein
MPLVLGAGVLVTTVLAALTTGAGAYGGVLRVGATVLAAVANIRLFTLAFRVLTASEVATRQLLLGAMVAGVGWQVVQILGTLLRHPLAEGQPGGLWVFGLVLGLIAWIYLLALVTVVATEINAVARDGCGRGRC